MEKKMKKCFFQWDFLSFFTYRMCRVCFEAGYQEGVRLKMWTYSSSVGYCAINILHRYPWSGVCARFLGRMVLMGKEFGQLVLEQKQWRSVRMDRVLQCCRIKKDVLTSGIHGSEISVRDRNSLQYNISLEVYRGGVLFALARKTTKSVQCEWVKMLQICTLSSERRWLVGSDGVWVIDKGWNCLWHNIDQDGADGGLRVETLRIRPKTDQWLLLLDFMVLAMIPVINDADTTEILLVMEKHRKDAVNRKKILIVSYYSPNNLPKKISTRHKKFILHCTLGEHICQIKGKRHLTELKYL